MMMMMKKVILCVRVKKLRSPQKQNLKICHDHITEGTHVYDDFVDCDLHCNEVLKDKAPDLESKLHITVLLDSCRTCFLFIHYSCIPYAIILHGATRHCGKSTIT